jgi:hypothetical protein
MGKRREKNVTCGVQVQAKGKDTVRVAASNMAQNEAKP